MAFKLKTGKTVNKILAGAGVVTLLGVIGNMVAPGFMGSTMGKAVEGLAAYSVGGVESVIGAGATMLTQSVSGDRAVVNTQSESL
jgi:hypothetical protein